VARSDCTSSVTKFNFFQIAYLAAACGIYSAKMPPSLSTGALQKPNDLLMVGLEELRESKMVLRVHFLTQFDLHLVD
jgi:hypothetical protein